MLVIFEEKILIIRNWTTVRDNIDSNDDHGHHLLTLLLLLPLIRQKLWLKKNTNFNSPYKKMRRKYSNLNSWSIKENFIIFIMAVELFNCWNANFTMRMEDKRILSNCSWKDRPKHRRMDNICCKEAKINVWK